MHIIPTLLILGISLILNLSLGVFVFIKNPRKLTNVLFCLFTIGIVGWGVTIFSLLAFGANLLIAKLTFSFAALMLSSFLLFSLVFPDHNEIRRFLLISMGIVGFIYFAFPMYDNLIVSGVSIERNFITVQFGSAYSSYVLFAPTLILISLVVLIRKYFYSTHAQKLQFQYLFLGATLFLVPAVFTNLLLPSFFNVWDYNALGPAFSFFMIATTTYAIGRHHLMDISLIIRPGTIYAALFGIITYLYTYLASLVGEYVSGSLTYIIPSILITFGFLPLKSLIETLTDRIFFRKNYSVQTIINQLNTIIHTSGLDLDQLLEKFNQVIIEFIRVEHAAILLLTPQGEFISRRARIDNEKKLVLDRNHLIIKHIYKYPEKLIDKEQMGDSMHKNLVGELNHLQTSLVIPIEVKGQVIGLYLVDAKKSQDPFTAEEIDLLKLIATESGSSIDNARLFEELKKIDEVKSKFISILSHQLRTPLTSIRWNLELLLQESFDQKTKYELFKNSYQGALSMAKNLDELFTALDIEEKGIIPQIKVEQANFHELLKEAMKEIDHEAKEKKLNLDISFPDELPTLALDKERISRVLAILLKNAVSYSNPGHEINVVGMTEVKNDINYFVCSVRDQGIGLTPEDEKGVFTRFYRGEEAKKHSPNGFGLGLFVAKYLVTLHHGEIRYTSQGLHRGSTFSFSLPIA